MSKPSSALDASSCDVYADSARHPLTRTWCVAALALICCALWGSAIPCIKIGYELLGIQNGDVPSEFLFAGVRFMLAGAIALAAAVITRRRLPRVSRTGWPLVIRLSLAQTIVQYAFFYIGVSNASGVRGSIVNAMNTFLCVLMAALVFRQERLTARKVLGCAIGFAGVVIVNLTGGDSGGAVTLTGEGFILIAAVSYAVSSALIHTYSQREDPWRSAATSLSALVIAQSPFGSTRCGQVTAGRGGRRTFLSENFAKPSFREKVSGYRPGRPGHITPCAAAGPAGR